MGALFPKLPSYLRASMGLVRTGSAFAVAAYLTIDRRRSALCRNPRGRECWSRTEQSKALRGAALKRKAGAVGSGFKTLQL